MGRPVAADPVATRRRILDAAVELFSSQGVGSSTVRQIAACAGVNPALVLHYFGSKEQLHDACLDEMFVELAALRDELRAALAGVTSLPALVDAGVRGAFRFARDHRRAVRFMLRQVIDTGEIGARRRDEILLPILDDGSRLLATVAGCPPLTARFCLLSLNHLIVRYALTAPHELALNVGVTAPPRRAPTSVVDGDADPATMAAVEDHLVDVARRLLGVAAAV